MAATTEESPASSKHRHIPAWLELIALLAVALTLSIIVKTFFVQMFFVPSESMKPLFVDNDRILVQKVSYWFGDVHRGDVVVFKDPGGWLDETENLSPLQRVLAIIGLYPTGGHLVKRVIGVGGDEVKCCDKRGRITVDGVPLDETSYLRKGTSPSDKRFDVTVPAGRLWVMGDNRSNSEDSRYHMGLDGNGTIPANDVVGKVWAVVWPLSRFHLFHTPATFNQDFSNSG